MLSIEDPIRQPFPRHRGFKERDSMIWWGAPPGTSLPEMNRVTTLAIDELKSVDEVRRVIGQVGRAVTSDIAADVNASQIWVSIEDDAGYGAMVADIEEIVSDYSGMAYDVETYSEEKLDEAREIEGAEDSIIVSI